MSATRGAGARDRGRRPKSRKDDHLDLCATGDVGFESKTTLFEEVHLVHDALPDLAAGDVDLATALLGKRLRAPLLVSAMTGGIERAEALNRDLASVAEEAGIGFALGSQRPLLQKGKREGYFVRDVAPTALLLGNLGVVQARETSTAKISALVKETGVDGLCVHLNPAMEAVQPEGDRDFRRGLETIRRLVAELPVPVVVKETGCGLSRSVGERLAAAGVRVVDTGGAGGTSWVGVEALRATGEGKALGERFWDWGIPTAASVAQLAGLGLAVVATGGVANGLDAAKAIALGATGGGIARSILQAWTKGGRPAVLAAVRQAIEEIRLACLLTGSRTPADLSAKPLVVGPRLRAWVPRGSPLARRLTSA